MIVCLPDVLNRQELQDIRATISNSQFQDGAATAGHIAKAVKYNEEMKRQTAELESIRKTLCEALARDETFKSIALVRILLPPIINRFKPGMEYGVHVDNGLIGRDMKVRTDLSITVFLSDPTDYDGGELVIQTVGGEQEVKLPAGSAVLYPSGNLHRVAPVTHGERVAAVSWIQSFIRDPLKREILHDLHSLIMNLRKQSPDSPEISLGDKIYHNLLRQWSEL